jgi:hypothetical protein
VIAALVGLIVGLFFGLAIIFGLSYLAEVGSPWS